MGSKHCNIDGRSVWTTRRTMFKNKPHLVIFHKYLSQPMNFSAEFRRIKCHLCCLCNLIDLLVCFSLVASWTCLAMKGDTPLPCRCHSQRMIVTFFHRQAPRCPLLQRDIPSPIPRTVPSISHSFRSVQILVPC